MKEKKKWRYRNDTDKTLIWRDRVWMPGKEDDAAYPIPTSIGLTQLSIGSAPDPVLFHEDIVVPAGGEAFVELDAPKLGSNVALSIFRMKGVGVECRFNSPENSAIPIDLRGFIHTIPWELCARMYFKNPTGFDVTLSMSAVEVIS